MADYIRALLVTPDGAIVIVHLQSPSVILGSDPEPIRGRPWIGFVNDEAEFDGAEPNALGTWIARTLGWAEGPRILCGVLVLCGESTVPLEGSDLSDGFIASARRIWGESFLN